MKIAIIGAGAMGSAIARGLIESGFKAEDMCISNPSESKLAVFRKFGCRVTSSNLKACEDADLVFIAVKPWILPGVVAEIKEQLDYERQALSVVAAGVSGPDLKEWFDRGGMLPVISLSMPNTAVDRRMSMTFVVAVTGNENNPDIDVYRRLGEVMVIEERMLPAATSLASCGIAYALRYIRAASEGGVQLGFRASEAAKIVAMTVKGAASLLDDGAHPEAEIDKVTTPGGLTIRGLNEMEKAGFTASVISGLLCNK